MLSCRGSLPCHHGATAAARCTWTVVGDLGDLACVCTMSMLTEFTRESWSVYLMLCRMHVFGVGESKVPYLTLIVKFWEFVDGQHVQVDHARIVGC